MGHKNKMRSELDFMAAQGSSKGLQNMTSNSASGHTGRPFKQFSTKSRAKSTLSFKGLHRIVPRDEATSDADSHHSGESSFRKSRSSDSLYRKRAISGLNMTTLGRVKSNPGHMPGSRSSSVNSSTSYSPSAVSIGLKPSTSKPTHSVVGLHNNDDEIDNDTTTDEEVEYFSDEDENVNENCKSQKSSPTADKIREENFGSRVERTPQETQMLSKSFSELTLPYKNSEKEAPPLVNQPSYKAPSSLIYPQQEEQLLSNDYNNLNDQSSATNVDANSHEKSVTVNENENNNDSNDNQDNNNFASDNDIDDNINNNNNEQGLTELDGVEPDTDTNEKIVHDDGDDRIDNNNINAVAAETSMEAGAHSLKRQGKNFEDTGTKDLPLMGTDESPNTNGSYISQRKNSGHEQYIPSMILSQSTGVERRFDQPASMQNSLANNYQMMPPLEEAQNGAVQEYNIGFNKENQINNSSNLPNGNRDQLVQQPHQPHQPHQPPPPPQQQQQQQPQQQSQQQPQQSQDEQEHSQQRQSLYQHFPQSHSLQNNQFSSQQYQQPQQRSQHVGNAKHNAQHTFSTSISSLTSSLQKMAPENAYTTSRKNHLLRKKPSQLSFFGPSLRGSNGDIPSSLLHRESSTPSDINNFAQFLKSDTMDGESRTQRKLWLQRENSIMDLSSQHDSSDSIFMASNIEVKREFERISHEYTNVRRFSNPIEEALTRVDFEQKNMGLKDANNQDPGMVDSLFSRPINEGGDIDEILPKSQSANLNRILESIWKEESALFNKDINPVNHNKSGISSHVPNTSRTSLKNFMNQGSALQHQRIINSLQPTTRAVNRRMENALHHQQRF